MGKKIIILYFFLSAFNLYAVATGWQNGIYFSKPLLMTVLAIWFYFCTKNNFTVFSKFILAGIIFSIGGDTFLMFVDKNPVFFLVGLGNFLITQLLYIFAFVNYPQFKKGLIFNTCQIAASPIISPSRYFDNVNKQSRYQYINIRQCSYSTGIKTNHFSRHNNGILPVYSKLDETVTTTDLYKLMILICQLSA